jgi:nicotinate-nucleotide adenylyltransferase
MLRLGLYGGSFDPIHHGHLILARQAVEDLFLDRVIFIPAAESPFKPDHLGASAEDRLAMISLAIQDEPRFDVDTALHKWNEFEQLDQLVNFAILSRSDLPLKVHYPVVHRRFDLSSTEIRNRVANNLPISYLVPENVIRYIHERTLYRGEAYRS